jgi:hypothetical protein
VRNPADALRILAVPMAVMISSAHMTRGVVKVVSWGGFLPYAAAEPSGAQAAAAMAAKQISRPGPLVPMAVAGCIGLVLLAAGFVLARREAQLMGVEGGSAILAPLAVQFAIFTTLVIGLSVAG